MRHPPDPYLDAVRFVAVEAEAHLRAVPAPSDRCALVHLAQRVLAVVPRCELDFIAASHSRTFLLCVLLSPLAGGWFFIRRVPVPVAVVAVVVSCIAHANAEVVGSSAAWDALVGLLRHLVEVIRVRRRLVGARRGCGVEIRDEFLVVTLVVFHHLCALLLLLLVLVRCKQAVHRVRVVHQQVVREGAVEGLLGVEAVVRHGARCWLKCKCAKEGAKKESCAYTGRGKAKDIPRGRFIRFLSGDVFGADFCGTEKAQKQP
jgi:hypothetical protein